MGALSGKAVLLVTHQVDFLPAFDAVLVSLFAFIAYLRDSTFVFFFSGFFFSCYLMFLQLGYLM